MTTTIPSSAISTQIVVILTDVQIAHPAIVCPITANLSPSAAYISLSTDFTTITVNPALLVMPTDSGSHIFTLTVNSKNFSGSVPQ